jgi:hypothetical protein
MSITAISLHLSLFLPPQVVLEGIRGPGIEDDVTLEEGECRDLPAVSEYRSIRGVYP